jgi:hypothetical protein
MGILWRRHGRLGAGLLALAACAVTAATQSNSLPASAASDTLSEEEAALLKELQLPAFKVWYPDFFLTTGAGYRDNIALSHYNPKGSGFFQTGGEFILWRMPTGGWQFYTHLAGEDLRYFSGGQVSKEQTFSGLIQLKKNLHADWLAGMEARYLYQNMVMDLSTIQGIPVPMPVRGHQFLVQPSLRWSFAPEFWVQAELILSRQNFMSPLDDFWEGGPKLSLGWNYRTNCELSLAYEFNYRPYDTRLGRDAEGFLIPDTALAYNQHRISAVWRHQWDERRRWQTALRVGYDYSSDNTGGFYDYRKIWCSQQVRFRHGKLELRANGRIAHYEYPVQTIGFGQTDLLRQTSVAGGIRGEFRLAKFLKLYLNYEHERSISNLDLSSYRVNSVMGGFLWEF